jgi:putative endonuclease
LFFGNITLRRRRISRVAGPRLAVGGLVQILRFMFYVYILKSTKNGRYYIGHTHDLNDRLSRHNNGQTKSTKSGAPWQTVHTEEYSTKQEAYRREFEIKSYKSGILFKKLLGLWKS